LAATFPAATIFVIADISTPGRLSVAGGVRSPVLHREVILPAMLDYPPVLLYRYIRQHRLPQDLLRIDHHQEER
jgi:hypothetical protein